MEKPRSRSAKAFKTALKIAFSALALWLVLSKVSPAEIAGLLRNASWPMLGVALVAFNVSKWYSAIRLRHLWGAIGVPITPAENLRLYYIGMFYNLFLPGGIGGDGYKVYYLHKRFGSGTRLLLAAVLLDRVAGAALLLGLALAMALFAPALMELLPEWAWWLVAIAAALSVPALIGVMHYFFPSCKQAKKAVVWWSFRVQAAQVICAWFIMRAIGIDGDDLLYLVLFLVSSLAAMLPISFGGVGLRELLFFYAATFLPIDQTSAVALGLVFFLITALSSFAGVFLKVERAVS